MKDGGAAFPSKTTREVIDEPSYQGDGGVYYPEPREISEFHAGMTLRDYFAAKAMAAFVGHSSSDIHTIARSAYHAADAMLAEREKGEQA